ncbi:hypothetical protein M5E87_21330 [Flavonifractor plautii]|nr:hypothetical protein M5E87_21330 [Flavonifractor plautii]
MSSTARMDRARLERFNRFWEELLQVVPDARRQAVEECKRGRPEGAQHADRRGGVGRWGQGHRAHLAGAAGGQQGRLCGPLPGKGTAQPRAGKRSIPGRESPCPKSRSPVAGAGARHPQAAGSSRSWNQAGRAGVARASAAGYVKGKQFYSWTKAKALELALKAADRVLSRIADEVDY